MSLLWCFPSMGAFYILWSRRAGGLLHLEAIVGWLILCCHLYFIWRWFRLKPRP
ncbi:MAG: hypothetical protein P8L18_13775 [Verrucomicrobiota bacterium]|nr:hypothetical protein [Verrucomicrobiota bacterium]